VPATAVVDVPGLDEETVVVTLAALELDTVFDNVEVAEAVD
jgi:hypothetical protein